MAASFAQSVLELIITQGFFYSVGASLIHYPALFYLDEWFSERKALAYGIVLSGTGIFGSVVPMILQWGLDSHGLRTTLRAWGIGCLTLILLLMFHVKPRLARPAKAIKSSQNVDFLQLAKFWVFLAGNVAQGLGLYLPQIYLPAYAASLGLSSLASTLSVSLHNLFCVVGLVFTGFLMHRYHISTVLLISALGSAGSVFLGWGFATTETALYLFAMSYGIFTGGYASTWAGCAAEVSKHAPKSETAAMIGIFGVGRGLGSVVSGPLSEMLLDGQIWEDAAGTAYGTEYRRLILFTGVTALLGGMGVLTRFGGAVERKVDEAREEETEPLLG
ncbi:hypothetical protein MMC13_008023 [Lambiella insularis]|nr:hypothetical protein [Lambiella insularis]